MPDTRITVNPNKVLLKERRGMVVSRFQAKAALTQAGLMPQIEAIMQDPETSDIVKLAWQDALEFRRDSLVINDLAAALDLTETEVDDLFRAAALITA